MRNKLLFIMFGGLLFAGFTALFAFDNPAEDEPQGTGGYVAFDYRKDTIANAAKDTLLIGNRASSATNTVTTPTNFLSLYTYDISVVRANLSGTTNLKVYLDRSCARSGTSTDWVLIDSAATTTATNAIVRGTDATGARYRLRISGTGTQSSTYQIWTIWKKKN